MFCILRLHMLVTTREHDNHFWSTSRSGSALQIPATRALGAPGALLRVTSRTLQGTDQDVHLACIADSHVNLPWQPLSWSLKVPLINGKGCGKQEGNRALGVNSSLANASPALTVFLSNSEYCPPGVIITPALTPRLYSELVVQSRHTPWFEDLGEPT